MRRRPILAVLAASLVAAPAAEAKLLPQMDKRVAAPGERVVVEFGAGTEYYLAGREVEVYLVGIGAAPTLTGRNDARLQPVGKLGRDRKTLSSTLAFRVPPLPTGRYTLAVYFRKTVRGRWYNLTEGLWGIPRLRDGLVIRMSVRGSELTALPTS